MLLSASGVRDPRFMSGISRTPGMSSTSVYSARMQLLDSAPVRPGWFSDDLFGSLYPSVELRFDPQRERMSSGRCSRYKTLHCRE